MGHDKNITMTTESCSTFIDLFILQDTIRDENGYLIPKKDSLYKGFGKSFQYELNVLGKQVIVIVQNYETILTYEEFVKPIKRKDKIKNFLKD